MKQFKLTFLLTVLMSMVGAKAFAYDIAVENADGVTIYYNNINDGLELEVTEKSTPSPDGSYSGKVVIPEEVTYMSRTRKVTSIGDRAFKSCSSLTSVTIPNSVTTIGDDAFYGCSSLTSVTIPNSVTTIGSSAFYKCSGLTSVTIGNSVTRIGKSAFSGCSSLTSVTIGNSVTSIGDYAFDYCKSLTSITIPNSVTSIGYSAFRDCSSLTSVTIGNSVTSIGGFAFNRCSSLISVTIPNSVTSIGSVAFGCENLATVVSLIENPFEIYTVFSQNTFMNGTLYVPTGTKEAYKATDGWKDFLFIEEGTGGNGTEVAAVRARTVLIQSQNGVLSISGAEPGQSVRVFSLSGMQLASATTAGDTTQIDTSLRSSEAVIVKIGDKSIKVVVK